MVFCVALHSGRAAYNFQGIVKGVLRASAKFEQQAFIKMAVVYVVAFP